MPHDPSTCPRCRWAAEREGYQYSEKAYHHWWKFTPGKGLRQVSSFCTSLDAVAGILKELLIRGWGFGWSVSKQQWYVYKFYYLPRPLECYFSDDYSCIIDAAMAVLGDKESDE